MGEWRYFNLLFTLLAAILLSSGCVFFPKETIPIRCVYHDSGQGRPAPGLIVLLPGYLSSPEDFVTHGFIAALRETKAPVDAITVDAHFAYYKSRSLPKRLRDDVILPARKRGYRSIWIVGISMGGTGVLWYEKTYPGTVNGILLLAPFLGDEPVIEEIERSGGLNAWRPNDPFAHDDYQRPLWAWLQNPPQNRERPLIYLGYGDRDKFARACNLLCDALPVGRCYTAPGGHEWPVWENLFRRFLRDTDLTRSR